jgi:NAD(P)-dependent dehydrogenase (short-subunit alcohol dehydrogenase family)
MATKPVLLILGSGPRVGASVAAKFASDGYNVAIASRKGTNAKTSDGFLSLQADFNKPESIPALFDTVKTEFSVAPNVVIYNAAALTPPPDKESLLSIPSESVAKDLTVNTVSPYTAAQQAVIAWETLPKETLKTFIFTGNIQNLIALPIPMMLNLGIGKSASAHWIEVADTLYATKGYR